MLKVNTNVNTEILTVDPYPYVAVWTTRNGENYITAYGENPTDVREEGRFHWAVIANYEGNFKVMPIEEITW